MFISCTTVCCCFSLYNFFPFLQCHTPLRSSTPPSHRRFHKTPFPHKSPPWTFHSTILNPQGHVVLVPFLNSHFLTSTSHPLLQQDQEHSARFPATVTAYHLKHSTKILPLRLHDRRASRASFVRKNNGIRLACPRRIAWNGGLHLKHAPRWTFWSASPLCCDPDSFRVFWEILQKVSRGMLTSDSFA